MPSNNLNNTLINISAGDIATEKTVVNQIVDILQSVFIIKLCNSVFFVNGSIFKYLGMKDKICWNIYLSKYIINNYVYYFILFYFIKLNF